VIAGMTGFSDVININPPLPLPGGEIRQTTEGESSEPFFPVSGG